MIQSVQRAISILEAVCAAPEPIGVHDLSRMLGLKVSTLHSLVKTLAALGYLSRDERGKYAPGEACRELAAGAEGRQALRRLAPPIMAELCKKIRENVFLVTRRGAGLSFLRMLSAEALLTVSDDAPGPHTLHALASGKLLMAYAPEDWVSAYLAAGLARFTPKTICSSAAMRAALAKIAKDGLAIADGEMSEDVVALAVPVRGYQGQVIAAVATSMPKVRYAAWDKDELAGLLRRSAAALSEMIGGRKPAASRG